jgi:hypothetical protein
VRCGWQRSWRCPVMIPAVSLPSRRKGLRTLTTPELVADEPEGINNIPRLIEEPGEISCGFRLDGFCFKHDSVWLPQWVTSTARGAPGEKEFIAECSKSAIINIVHERCTLDRGGRSIIAGAQGRGQKRDRKCRTYVPQVRPPVGQPSAHRIADSRRAASSTSATATWNSS